MSEKTMERRMARRLHGAPGHKAPVSIGLPPTSIWVELTLSAPD
jgi:hypothetical protein